MGLNENRSCFFRGDESRGASFVCRGAAGMRSVHACACKSGEGQARARREETLGLCGEALHCLDELLVAGMSATADAPAAPGLAVSPGLTLSPRLPGGSRPRGMFGVPGLGTRPAIGDVPWRTDPGCRRHAFCACLRVRESRRARVVIAAGAWQVAGMHRTPACGTRLDCVTGPACGIRLDCEVAKAVGAGCVTWGTP